MSVEVINPWSGEVEYRYDYQGAESVESALARAQAAFPAWSALALEERAAFVRRIAAAMRQHRERIAGIMTAEMGKLRREALAEIEKSAGACDYYADHAGDYLRDQSIPTEATRSSHSRHAVSACAMRCAATAATCVCCSIACVNRVTKPW